MKELEFIVKLKAPKKLSVTDARSFVRDAVANYVDGFLCDNLKSDIEVISVKKIGDEKVKKQIL